MIGMRTSEFDYFLPEDRIAQVPAARGSSRLLVLAGPGPARHRRISDLPQLLDTGDQELVEYNTWGDTYWGVCTRIRQGQNWLGKILMEVREELQK